MQVQDLGLPLSIYEDFQPTHQILVVDKSNMNQINHLYQILDFFFLFWVSSLSLDFTLSIGSKFKWHTIQDCLVQLYIDFECLCNIISSYFEIVCHENLHVPSIAMEQILIKDLLYIHHVHPFECSHEERNIHKRAQESRAFKLSIFPN